MIGTYVLYFLACLEGAHHSGSCSSPSGGLIGSGQDILLLFDYLNALAHALKSRHPDVEVLDHDARQVVVILKAIMDSLGMPLRRPKIHELLMMASDVLRFGNSFNASTCK